VTRCYSDFIFISLWEFVETRLLRRYSLLLEWDIRLMHLSRNSNRLSLLNLNVLVIWLGHLESVTQHGFSPELSTSGDEVWFSFDIRIGLGRSNSFHFCGMWGDYITLHQSSPLNVSLPSFLTNLSILEPSQWSPCINLLYLLWESLEIVLFESWDRLTLESSGNLRDIANLNW